MRIPLNEKLVGQTLKITTTRGAALEVGVTEVLPHTPELSFEDTPTGTRLKVKVSNASRGNFNPEDEYSLFFLWPNDKFAAHPPHLALIHMGNVVSQEACEGFWALLAGHGAGYALQVRSITL